MVVGLVGGFSTFLTVTLKPKSSSFPKIELQTQLQDVYTIGYQKLSVSFLSVLTEGFWQSIFAPLLICW